MVIAKEAIIMVTKSGTGFVDGVTGLIDKLLSGCSIKKEGNPALKFDKMAILEKVAELVFRPSGQVLHFDKRISVVNAKSPDGYLIKEEISEINKAIRVADALYSPSKAKNSDIKEIFTTVRSGILCYAKTYEDLGKPISARLIVACLEDIDHAIAGTSDVQKTFKHVTQFPKPTHDLKTFSIVAGMIGQLKEVFQPDLKWQESYEKKLRDEIDGILPAPPSPPAKAAIDVQGQQPVQDNATKMQQANNAEVLEENLVPSKDAPPAPETKPNLDNQFEVLEFKDGSRIRDHLLLNSYTTYIDRMALYAPPVDFPSDAIKIDNRKD